VRRSAMANLNPNGEESVYFLEYNTLAIMPSPLTG
jgi:hypothetical protein